MQKGINVLNTINKISAEIEGKLLISQLQFFQQPSVNNRADKGKTFVRLRDAKWAALALIDASSAQPQHRLNIQ